MSVPLSEDEQRILHQIEQQFYETDPDFARSVSQTTLYRHAFRNIKWGVLLFCGGVVMLLLTLSVHFLLAFVGVLIMLVALIFIERNARKLGRAGMEQMTAVDAGQGRPRCVRQRRAAHARSLQARRLSLPRRSPLPLSSGALRRPQL